MHKRFLLLILIVSFFKEIVWISLVPLWHFPDEQSHFGQVAYIAETGSSPTYEKNDLTEEIRKSEELLGTERDGLGINKFTYHPEYRIEYTNNSIGKYEQEIISLAQSPSARVMVKQESSHYPSFYYSFLAGFYRLLYHNDLFIRVFVIRIVQSIFAIGTIYLSWLIGKLIFPKSNLLPLTVSLLVSFQPMFSYVSAGINSDNVGNFIFTLYLLVSLKILKNGFNTQRFFVLIFVTFFSIYFKPQFIIVIPLTLIILTVGFLKSNFALIYKFMFAGLLWLNALLGIDLSIRYKIGLYKLYQKLLETFDLTNFISFFKSYVPAQLYREVLPWYWGVYDWLGVTYPRIIHRLINWIIAFAVFGFLVWFIKSIKKREWPFGGILFLILANFMLVVGVYGFDWLQIVTINTHLGVQGRYFFPTISSQMLLILLGIITIIPKKRIKVRYFVAKLLGFTMIALNFFALYTVAKTYYDIWSISLLLREVSQYKPFMFKGIWLGGIWIGYLIILVLFLIEYTRYPDDAKS